MAWDDTSPRWAQARNPFGPFIEASKFALEREQMPLKMQALQLGVAENVLKLQEAKMGLDTKRQELEYQKEDLPVGQEWMAQIAAAGEKGYEVQPPKPFKSEKWRDFQLAVGAKQAQSAWVKLNLAEQNNATRERIASASVEGKEKIENQKFWSEKEKYLTPTQMKAAIATASVTGSPTPATHIYLAEVRPDVWLRNPDTGQIVAIQAENAKILPQVPTRLTPLQQVDRDTAMIQYNEAAKLKSKAILDGNADEELKQQNRMNSLDQVLRKAVTSKPATPAPTITAPPLRFSIVPEPAPEPVPE